MNKNLRYFLLSTIVIIVALSMCAGQQIPGHPLEIYNDTKFKNPMFGPVKRQLMNVYIQTGMPEKRNAGESYIIEERFNPDGYRTLESVFTIKNLLVGKSLILHNLNGYQTEVIYMDLMDNVLNRITYKYNKQKKWEQTVNYDRYYNPMEVFNYYYTPDGYISEIRKTDMGGNLLRSQIFLYDSLLNYNTDIIFYDSIGSQIANAEFLFNQKGYVSGYRMLDRAGRLVELYEVDYQADTVLLASQREEYSDGKLVTETITTYDPLGNILKVSTRQDHDSLPRVTEFLYEWDLWGNWTKQIIKRPDGDTVAAERIIEYYIPDSVSSKSYKTIDPDKFRFGQPYSGGGYGLGPRY